MFVGQYVKIIYDDDSGDDDDGDDLLMVGHHCGDAVLVSISSQLALCRSV